jgi:hypothetical protein
MVEESMTTAASVNTYARGYIAIFNCFTELIRVNLLTEYGLCERKCAAVASNVLSLNLYIIL